MAHSFYPLEVANYLIQLYQKNGVDVPDIKVLNKQVAISHALFLNDCLTSEKVIETVEYPALGPFGPVYPSLIKEYSKKWDHSSLFVTHQHIQTGQVRASVPESDTLKNLLDSVWRHSHHFSNEKWLSLKGFRKEELQHWKKQEGSPLESMDLLQWKQRMDVVQQPSTPSAAILPMSSTELSASVGAAVVNLTVVEEEHLVMPSVIRKKEDAPSPFLEAPDENGLGSSGLLKRPFRSR